LNFQNVVCLLCLFVSLTPKVFVPCQLLVELLQLCQSFQGFNEDRQLLGLSQMFKVNDMQDNFAWRSLRVSGAAKVNNNRLLEEEKLAFLGAV
jgi:hypothetical protein